MSYQLLDIWGGSSDEQSGRGSRLLENMSLVILSYECCLMSRVLLCGFAFLYAHVLSSGHARRHAPVCFEYIYIYIL